MHRQRAIISRGSSHARCAASFSEDDAVLDCDDDDHRNDAVLDRHDAVFDRNDAVLDRHDAEVAPPLRRFLLS